MMAPRLPSLRRLMLWRVLLPLALTWLVGSALALGVADWYTQRAFDRSLVDDAFAIAAQVSERDGELAFNLNAQGVAVALFDRDERTFFSVLREDGSLLAGQGGLVDEPVPADEPWMLQDRHYRGLELRMVTLVRQRPRPHRVVVAQTTLSRSRLTTQLFAASLLPQALLLVALGAWLRRSIGEELQPLVALEQALAQREAGELAPLQLAELRNRDIAVLAGAFNSLLARIADSVRAQREFAGNVAHELRTPLAGIRSLAAYGIGHADPQVWLKQLHDIAASERRASRMVDQLLALALADEAQGALELAPVALHTLVSDVVLRRLPQADASGVDLGAEGLEAPLWVRGTSALLEGLLGNLIDNALRHGRPAPVAGQAGPARVTVVAQVDGERVRLSVIDNGPGLDADELQRVRSRWEQGAARGPSAGGVGLGLAIVERYAALLGSALELVPAPDGRGLSATVSLQRAEAPA